MEEDIDQEDNRALREEVSASPSAYLKIPGLSHGKCHNILQAFLSSDWTTEKSAKEGAQSAYFRSVGGWIKTVKDETAVSEYYRFREQHTKELAETFLRDNGIDPFWR